MNRAQAVEVDTLKLPAHCEMARLLLHPPAEIIAAHSRYTNHRKLPADQQNEDRNPKNPGGRKRTEKVLKREREVRAKVMKYLRHKSPERVTFVEICHATGIRIWKMNRDFVFGMAERGEIHTDLQPWGRRLWLEKGE